MSEEDKAVRLKALAREIRDDLGEHNVLDALARELAANRLALSDLNKELSALRRELDSVHLVQKTRDILLPQARTQYAGRKRAAVDAGMPMPPDRGFYALERDGVGNPFRWTGPGTAFHFDFHLDRSETLRFVLQLPLWGDEHAKGLRAMSDDIVLPLLRRPGGRAVEFEGMLLPRETLGVTRLTFIADHVSQASGDAEGGATRQLGLPFMRLSISEASDSDFSDWLKSIEPGQADAVMAAKAESIASVS